MLGEPITDLDLERQRRLPEILGTAIRLYGRAPLLFLFLAGIVVVPYEVAVVLLEHGKGQSSTGTAFLLGLVGLALVNPCIAAVQVQAILDLGQGERPRVADVIRRGLSVLPVVAAAEIIADIGIAIGFVCFLIPGVLLAIRWAVVAQAAAVERTDWPTALRRSGQLARRNYWRILGLLFIGGILSEVSADVVGTGSHLGSTIVGIALAVLAGSFGTLLINLLYFDLRARENAPLAS
jgi:hypothetical protein